MTSRRHLGLVAGAATLLAALPLATVFEEWTWFVRCLITVMGVTGAAIGARALRAPAWGQVAAMTGALLVVLTFLTPDSGAVLGLLPTTETFARFGELLEEAGIATREMGVPVSDHDGLLLLTTLGVGAVAICVDVCAVVLRRPAVAGLPMLAIYSVPVAVHQDSVSILPFIAGAAGFLWLLVADNVDRVRRFGRRFTGDGRDIEVWEPSPLAAAGRRMAIVGVLVAVAVPLAIPGMTTGLLDRFGSGGDGPGSGSGRGGRVNLWAMLEGTLKQDEEIEMLRVATGDPNPGYLRFGVADELSREGFRNRPPAGRQTTDRLPDPRRQAGEGVQFHEDKATVEVVNFNMNLLPVYSEPLEITKGVDSRWFYDRRMQVIFSPSSTVAGRTYEFTYARGTYDVAALQKAQPLPEDHEIRLRNSAVPEGVTAVETEVARLTAGKTNDYDKVRALYDFFSSKNGFTYTLDAESETGGEAIVEFLTRRSGFCVQYAAALAWMVREAGIPARVAFGFTRGTRSEGGVYRLTNRNLHAWTEVYFDGFGWVPFDATPSTYVAGSVDPAWAPNPDAPEVTPTAPGATPDPGSSTDPNSPDGGQIDGGLLPEDDDLGFAPVTPAEPRWPRYLAVAVAVVVLLLALPALRRALLRRGRRPRARATGTTVAVSAARPGEPHVLVPGGADAAKARHEAHAAWAELLDTLVDYRLPVDLAETPRTTAQRLVRDVDLGDEAARGAQLLGQAEERARYAREPLLTAELGPALSAVRRAVARQAPTGVRLRALLLPPSVLLAWRQAIVSGATAVATTTGRWRDTVVRAVNPRRLLASRVSR
ncbi:MAG: DUF3488 and transglutaminase-like domain-containing protein [Micromonosporaceae bacterium]